MKLLFLLFSIILIGIPQINAATEEIGYFSNRFMWDYDPMVCLHAGISSNAAYPLEQLDSMLIGSLQRWLSGLNAYAGDEVFKVYYKQVQTHSSWEADLQYQHYGLFFPDCDINVYYLAAPALDSKTGEYFHGWTSHQIGSKQRTTVVIWTYDFDQKDFRELSDDHKAKIANATGSIDSPPDVTWFHMRPSHEYSLESTTDHELGHAFGLRHFMYNGTLSGCSNCNGYDPEIAKKSVMYYVTPRDVSEEDVKKLTDFDIQALLYKYTLDGFGGETNFLGKKYKITTEPEIEIIDIESTSRSLSDYNYHIKR